MAAKGFWKPTCQYCLEERQQHDKVPHVVSWSLLHDLPFSNKTDIEDHLSQISHNGARSSSMSDCLEELNSHG